MSHQCHAEGCSKEIPPRMAMCPEHWNMVTFKTQAAVWRHYRAGQEIDKKPSWTYLAMMRVAIAEVARREGRESARAKPSPRQLDFAFPD